MFIAGYYSIDVVDDDETNDQPNQTKLKKQNKRLSMYDNIWYIKLASEKKMKKKPYRKLN